MLVSAAAGAGATSVSAEALGAITSLDARLQASVAASDDPDALYHERESLPQATRAVEVWKARFDANPKDFESAWKLARGYYWLGTIGLPQPQRRAALESGVAAGKTAAALEPNRPEGHYWMAANMGALAESFGLRQGIKYRTPVREALERVLAIDPAFLQGSADRALGRWYFKVPGMFGGDDRKSEQHLRKALTYNENSIITHLFLAETLEELNKRDEAIEQLRAALAAPLDPDWTPEDKRFKQESETLLKKLTK
jgi:tetratricopeptide (TPR) repeat protein